MITKYTHDNKKPLNFKKRKSTFLKKPFLFSPNSIMVGLGHIMDKEFATRVSKNLRFNSNIETFYIYHAHIISLYGIKSALQGCQSIKTVKIKYPVTKDKSIQDRLSNIITTMIAKNKNLTNVTIKDYGHFYKNYKATIISALVARKSANTLELKIGNYSCMNTPLTCEKLQKQAEKYNAKIRCLVHTTTDIPPCDNVMVL